MSKILYALVVILLFIAGMTGMFYGLYIFWQPLAYVIGGLFLIGLAVVLNEAYDSTSHSKGGDK